MAGPIFRLIRRTGRGRFLGAAALSTFYAVWLAAGDSPLTRARNAVGPLPELTPGFHAGEPAATLARLGAARGDYLWGQAFDAVFAALIAMTALFALALAAKKPGSAFAALSFLMLVPISYAGAELIENVLLTLFASGAMAPAPAPVFVQQAATTLKLMLAGLSVFLIFSVFPMLIGARQRLENSL